MYIIYIKLLNRKTQSHIFMQHIQMDGEGKIYPQRIS